jgi:hypothetical protein
MDRPLQVMLRSLGGVTLAFNEDNCQPWFALSGLHKLCRSAFRAHLDARLALADVVIRNGRVRDVATKTRGVLLRCQRWLDTVVAPNLMVLTFEEIPSGNATINFTEFRSRHLIALAALPALDRVFASFDLSNPAVFELMPSDHVIDDIYLLRGGRVAGVFD